MEFNENFINEKSLIIPKSNSQLCMLTQRDVILTNNVNTNPNRNRTGSFNLGIGFQSNINHRPSFGNITTTTTTSSLSTRSTKNSLTEPINIVAQRHYVMEMLNVPTASAGQFNNNNNNNINNNNNNNNQSTNSRSSLNNSECGSRISKKLNIKNRNRQIADDNLSTILSTFYAKFMVVLGIAFPVTDILSLKAPPSFYQGFYLYLYLVSVTFVIFIFVSHLRQRRNTLLESYDSKFNSNNINNNNEKDETTSTATGTPTAIPNEQNCNENYKVLQTGGAISITRTSSTATITKPITNSTTNVKTKNSYNSNNTNNDNKSFETFQQSTVRRYGSFYLRIGAVGFGIGSMVYSGLEFGQYFELKQDVRCQNILIILNPAARMLLTIVQMQFIYLNTKDLGLNKNTHIARFGLMHMIATNICEWLYVLVEETKHEIINIANKDIDSILNDNSILFNDNNNYNYNQQRLDNITTKILHQYNGHHTLTKRATSLEIVVECRRTNIMGLLVQNASPFLFPCTIEYSLICAVTLFEMWKTVRNNVKNKEKQKQHQLQQYQNRLLKKFQQFRSNNNLSINYNINNFNNNDNNNNNPNNINKSLHHLSVDCTKAHKGMFAGILVTVLTIISLVIYFEMASRDLQYKQMGIFGITISEFLLYICGIIAAFLAMFKMRDLRYCKAYNTKKSVDCELLLVTQSGVFIYSMFSIIGSYFSLNNDSNALISLITELLSLMQTSIQTLFILNVWWRRCQSSQEIRKKPGKEIVTFLLIANIALWLINSLIKSRAVFRPTHLTFFGQWAWTIITHISIPLAIFYRLHSTICLFEIWKKTFKNQKNQHI